MKKKFQSPTPKSRDHTNSKSSKFKISKREGKCNLHWKSGELLDFEENHEIRVKRCKFGEGGDPCQLGIT
jgi:hypothetical protein